MMKRSTPKRPIRTKIVKTGTVVSNRVGKTYPRIK